MKWTPNRSTDAARAAVTRLLDPLPSGVYAVLVPPDTSDEPVRWLFRDEVDADAFAAACGPDAWVSYEPIAETLDDPDLAGTFPDETAAARKAVREPIE